MPTSKVAELAGLNRPWLFHVRTVQVYSSPALRGGSAVRHRLRGSDVDTAAVPDIGAGLIVADGQLVGGL